MLDECLNLLKSNRKTNFQIDSELNKQQENLNDLENKIDKNNTNIIKSKNKLEKYIHENNNNILLGIICLEIISICLLILFF